MEEWPTIRELVARSAFLGTNPGSCDYTNGALSAKIIL